MKTSNGLLLALIVECNPTGVLIVTDMSKKYMQLSTSKKTYSHLALRLVKETSKLFMSEQFSEVIFFVS
jgi:hypothetical protein